MDPFRNYDAWLEAPIQRAYAEGERWEAASELYESTDDYMPALIEWVTDQLRELGNIPIVTEQIDIGLKQETIDALVEAFRESPTYDAIITGMMQEDEYEPDPDDYDRGDPYDIEYDR